MLLSPYMDDFTEISSDLLEKDAAIPALCSFGPTTSDKMKNAGIPVAVEAESPGLDGMVDALISYFSGKD